MGQLCAKCAQLLYDLVLSVRTFSSNLVQDVKECLTQIRDCSCLKQMKAEDRQLYKPTLREEVIAQEFLQHIERGFEISPLDELSLSALKTLAFSENSDSQKSASLFYLHISQHLPKEHVIQMDLLEPILELLESSDATVQCNSCACIMILAVSDTNREAIASAGGVVPLLTLSKSYDPRVQQYAVGAIFNLTQSEWVQQMLCRQGALPVLTLLLESSDSEVQYYSCAALSNMAANSQHHEVILQTGDQSLLQVLLSLLSSPVDKVSNQACVCLRNLVTSESVQTSLIAMGILPHLLSLLDSNNIEVQQNSIILLRMLSQHTANQDALVGHQVLQSVGRLLIVRKTDPVIIGHASCFIKNLNSPKSIMGVIESSCVEGLLQAIHGAEYLDEESLHCVTSCLGELVKHEGGSLRILELTDELLLSCLLRLAGQVEQTEPSFQTAIMIKHLIQHGEVMHLLKSHISKIQQYLMKYLTHQETRFQQLGISTLCLLQKDSEFSSAFSQSQLKEHLDQICQQTEEMQELLRMAVGNIFMRVPSSHS
ncbi:vacuolar protein 8-like isoform X2 [Sphaerodactylus townsendi]|uniref:vacuolar protein 8-like isoform X2 n=1 Tax=Sphaerodactylus townsendi TaxID=933632 RepID=UPI002026AB75|nr:vacuolar protein 8-like isoform X2 [Sphaerodactylus townsendi]